MSLLPDHPHSSFLLRVSKPARYAGPEHGAVAPPPSPRVSLALAFPDVYEIGCSNLGIAILYRIAAGMPGVHVERAFAPWADYARELRDRRCSLVSHETGRPLRTFDIVGFSLQHELLCTNVLLMLDLAGIPLRSEARGERDPLVMAGGPSASNPEPLAPFIDAFGLGDGEPLLPAVLEAVAAAKADGRPRRALLEALAVVRGVYVPAFYRREKSAGPRFVVTGASPPAPLPVRTSLLRRLEDSPVVDPVITALEPVFDRYQVEISRGCCGGCRFCHAGSVYRPLRHRPPDQVLRGAVEGTLRTGHSAVSLGSLSPADYPFLGPVASAMEDTLRRRRILLSVSSLRSYGVSESVLRAIASVKATGITLAPEAGTQRLRDIIGKRVTDEDLRGSLELLAGLGWRRVKLYFMIGLPGETEEDLEGIVETVRRCLQAGAGRRRMEVTAAVSNFVPKPFTAFQWEAMAALSALDEKRRVIRRAARGLRAEIAVHSAPQSIVEGILARGGGELADVIEGAFRLGASMDGWSDRFGMDVWLEALRRSGLAVEPYMEALPLEDPLPWSHIRAPVSTAWLRRELEMSRRAEAGPACGALSGAAPVHACGADCEVRQAPPASAVNVEELKARAQAAVAAFEKQADAFFGRPLAEDERTCLALTFRRSGRAIYPGHQDMIRILRHIFSRAALPMRHSAGFTPRPVMSFRCALPVGVVGLNEQVFVEIEREPLRLDDLRAHLDRTTHPGIAFTAAAALPRRDVRALLGALPPVDWTVIVEGGEEAARRAVEAVSGSPSLPVERRRRDGRGAGGQASATVDLRSMIAGTRLLGGGELPEGEPLPAGTCALLFSTVPVGGGLVRMDDLRALLEPRGLAPVGFIRRLAG